MDISSTVANKIRSDRELADILRTAKAHDSIEKKILIILDLPDTPKRRPSEEERILYFTRLRSVVADAKEAFAAIQGLRVHKVMEKTGQALVSGTAEAVLRALELEYVQSAIIGDRPIIQGSGTEIS
jgi:hypothetical protein